MVNEPIDVASLNRRENQLTAWVAILAAVALVQTVAIGALAVSHQAVARDARERSEVIDRIDSSERHGACLAAIGLRFTVAIVDTLGTSGEDRPAAVERLLAAGDVVRDALADGTDPCSINLPITEEEP